MSHEQEQTKEKNLPSPITYAVGLGNSFRSRLHETIEQRRAAIELTELNTPSYQATLNCMAADSLTAVATVIQDYIERMTHDLELERQRKREEMDGQFSGFTKD